VKQLSERKAVRLQRRSSSELRRVTKYCGEYAAGSRSAARLLSACKHAWITSLIAFVSVTSYVVESMLTTARHIKKILFVVSVVSVLVLLNLS